MTDRDRSDLGECDVCGGPALQWIRNKRSGRERRYCLLHKRELPRKKGACNPRRDMG